MTIHRIDDDRLVPLTPTTLAEQGLRERQDLQQLLLRDISVLDPDLLVVAEEFGDWEDSRRRIDLLALDRDANLVVIELKRDDSAHMELQAIRYAAMVAPMTFDQVVEKYGALLEEAGSESDARAEILAFLGADAADGDPAIQDVRILLAAGTFSKEITTSVLWLNERGLDVRCVRINPYRLGEELLLDVQQLIPLKEAEEYIVQLREKRRSQAAAGSRGGTEEEFWSALPPALHHPARELLNFLTEEFSYIWPGVGSMVPILRIGRTKHHVFRIRTDGEVAVYFDLLARKGPFSDPGLRMELLHRLNKANGINLPEDRLERRPRFLLSALEKPDSMTAVQEALRWWADTIRGAGPEGLGEGETP